MNPILATSQFCGPCKQIKAYIDEKSLDIEMRELGSDPAFFLGNNIKTVPALVFPDKSLITGAENIMSFLKDYEKSKSR